MVRCVLEGKQYTSSEIDRIFSASKAQGKSLYFVDQELLESIGPDIVFTQDICEVCQIDTNCTNEAVSRLSKRPQVITIAPKGMDDVFAAAITIATAVGAEEKAYSYLASLHARIDSIVDTLRANKAMPKRILLMEWIDPIYNCGHWIPDQIALAGGVDMLSNPRGDSAVISWDKILRYDPEVIVVAPCGFGIERTRDEMALLSRRNGWNSLRAVQDNNVHIVDFELFTQPSASTLVDGIEVLASLFHPALFVLNEEKKLKILAGGKIAV